MKSIRIKKEYMKFFKNKNTDEFILKLIDDCGNDCYKSNHPDLLKKYEYEDLELSDDVFELLTKYSLANEESYDLLINRLLIYSHVKEFDGSMIPKMSLDMNRSNK